MPAKLPTKSDRADLERKIREWDEPPVSVATIDLDGFKEINDTYGRRVGDAVLKLVSEVLLRELPKEAACARVSGDEFVCALPRTGAEETLIFLDSIRRSLAARPHKFGRASLKVSMSAGIATWPQHAEEPSALLPAADEALQRAKREGRSRIAIYVEDKMVLKSNYYTRGQLSRLATLAHDLKRTEASLLREALENLLEKNKDKL